MNASLVALAIGLMATTALGVIAAVQVTSLRAKVRPSPPSWAPALTVACPYCGAARRELCVTLKGETANSVHMPRLAVALGFADEVKGP